MSPSSGMCSPPSWTNGRVSAPGRTSLDAAKEEHKRCSCMASLPPPPPDAAGEENDPTPPHPTQTFPCCWNVAWNFVGTITNNMACTLCDHPARPEIVDF